MGTTTPVAPMSARVYTVWRVDCDCGSVVEYGEDDSSIPTHCEDCGEAVNGDTETS